MAFRPVTSCVRDRYVYVTSPTDYHDTIRIRIAFAPLFTSKTRDGYRQKIRHAFGGHARIQIVNVPYIHASYTTLYSFRRHNVDTSTPPPPSQKKTPDVFLRV